MFTNSILLVIDGEYPVRGCLERTLRLALALRARVEILLWRDWSSYASQLRPWGTEEAVQYLHALRHSILCPGVVFTLQASFGGSLVKLINEQVRQQNFIMVVKVRRHGHSWHESSVDCDLMRSCTAPLLLTHGHPWAQPPRFAAAVKVLGEDSTVDRNIIQTAAAFQRVCAAHLDLVYAQPSDAALEAPEGESPALLLLQQRAQSCHVDPQSVHVLDGQAGHVVSQFVTAMHYDLLVIGTPRELRHPFWRWTASSLDEALTKRSCDLLVVNDDHRNLATALASAQPTQECARTLLAVGT